MTKTEAKQNETLVSETLERMSMVSMEDGKVQTS